MSLDALREKTGLSFGFMQGVEVGTKTPDANLIKLLSEMFDVPLENFYKE
jgi:hypothetical protein